MEYSNDPFTVLGNFINAQMGTTITGLFSLEATPLAKGVASRLRPNWV